MAPDPFPQLLGAEAWQPSAHLQLTLKVRVHDQLLPHELSQKELRHLR